MATHSSVLAWRIPGTGEPGGLPSMGSHRVEHDWSDLASAAACYAMLRGSVMSESLQPHGLQPARLLCPWGLSRQNTGVGCHALLQGIFPTQGSNPDLPHCREILYHLSHQGRPRTLEWVAYPFSRGSSWLRNRTGISCITRGFFTSWATREAKLEHRFRNYAVKVWILGPRWWPAG